MGEHLKGIQVKNKKTNFLYAVIINGDGVGLIYIKLKRKKTFDGKTVRYQTTAGVLLTLNYVATL